MSDPALKLPDPREQLLAIANANGLRLLAWDPADNDAESEDYVTNAEPEEVAVSLLALSADTAAHVEEISARVTETHTELLNLVHWLRNNLVTARPSDS